MVVISMLIIVNGAYTTLTMVRLGLISNNLITKVIFILLLIHRQLVIFKQVGCGFQTHMVVDI